jgi:hypothetical protein
MGCGQSLECQVGDLTVLRSWAGKVLFAAEHYPHASCDEQFDRLPSLAALGIVKTALQLSNRDWDREIP